MVGELKQIEVIAFGAGVREASRLRAIYGGGRWRKLKGIARVRLATGRRVRAEIHWYEAHGIGVKEMKIKRLVD